ncbi:MAG: T9SS type A sorting domain-containing protein [Cyclobacteriaceae bacterium]
MRKGVYLLVAFFIIYRACYAQLPAFPGAEGYGSNTAGGRGGKVLLVTNLNDHGPGSLREALEAEFSRVIVFTTGGIINLETELVIESPYVTVAGQSAPGDGICIRGERIRISTHDVVIRYLKSRPGDIDFGPENKWPLVDAISINGRSYNVIIDHCSLSWAVDENIEVWQYAHDITIQHCLISEALNHSKHPKGAHGMGMIIGSKGTRVSVHHNILAHNNDRNPHINGRSIVDFRNNIIYDPGGVASDIGANNHQRINYVGNYIIKGPHTGIHDDLIIRNVLNQTPRIYQSDNIGAANRFKIGYYEQNDINSRLHSNETSVLANILLEQPYPSPEITMLPTDRLLDYLPSEVGATLPTRDPVDKKVIRDIINRKGGLVNRKGNVLEWPPYSQGIPLLDQDKDGMPDFWEERYGFDIMLDDSALDADGDEYTNIEEYLNHTNPSGVEDFLTLGQSPPLASPGSNIDFPPLPLALEKVYPNPYDEMVNLEFSVDRPSKVVINVSDGQGREISRLVESFMYEGKYKIIWNTNGVEPGVYHINIVAGKKSHSVKTVLARQ